MFSAAVLMCMVSTGLPAPVMRIMFKIFGERMKDGDHAEVPSAIPEEPKLSTSPAVSAPDRPVLATLEFGGEFGTAKITSPRTVIGRHSDADVRVNDVRVSRHHALLVQGASGRFEVHNQMADRSEPNPILVNGEPKEHAVLSDGDKISLGGVPFVFHLAAAK